MSAFISDWLNLAFRWAHIVVGIGWIGTSFYFIALDLALRKRAQMKPGVLGTAWEVHGGGFYHVEKFTVAPPELPPDLVWFRWEAYLTWATGFCLLAIQYYWHAGAFLIDRAVMDLQPIEAIAISVATLALGWFGYDALCRSPLGRNTGVLAAILFLGIVGFAWIFSHVFSGRGALIHVGALVGTIMAANVFAVIIPNQRRIVAALMAHEPPHPALGAMGKQRSVHNNYLTLPVLVLMVSNHYPMLTGHREPWLVVALILVLGASVRHFLNRHDAGDPFRRFAWTLPVALLALAAAVLVTAPRETAADVPAGVVVSDAEALGILTTRCAECHAAMPSNPAFQAPPRGVTLESIDDLRRYAGEVRRQAVETHAMPLGNLTGMTDDERARLGAWIAANT